MIGGRQYRETESNCASEPPAREPENVKAGGKARERETNASDPLTAPEARKGRETNVPCPRETAKSMGAWETNKPERRTAPVRRDGELLTSAAKERWQREAAAERHQAAAGEQPPLFAREGTGLLSSPAIDPKTGLCDIVGTDRRQLTAAKISRVETSHSDPKPVDDPAAKLRLEARCKIAGCLKTVTDNLSPLAVQRIIQVAN